ncbi:GNAT family N-acetyltransferase [Companilactobacillus kimchiensis]|nr:GNAT family N-acetyltransferase [Companilactobacillus kimchiensis]
MDKYRLTESDFEAYTELFYYSFNIDPNEADKKTVRAMYEHADVYGSKVNGQLMTSVMCLPLMTNFFGRKFKITSFANVMSAPEYSNSKGINILTNQAMIDMHQNNVVLSYLDPFSYDYYRRFGYEQVFELLKMTIPFNKFAKRPQATTGYIKRYKFFEVADEIHGIFDKYNTHGGIVEEPWLWDILKLRYPNYLAALTFDDNKVTGYLIYSIENKIFTIHDIIYQTTDSFLNMMHFIRKHSSICKTLVIRSADTNLKPDVFVTDPLATKVEIDPFMMVRIIDLSEFMTNYPTQMDNVGTIRINVTDDLAWNNHLWDLSIYNGKVKFVESAATIGDVSVDIQTLTKAMFGYQRLEESFMIGEVLGDLDKIRTIDQIFINEPAQLNGEF